MGRDCVVSTGWPVHDTRRRLWLSSNKLRLLGVTLPTLVVTKPCGWHSNAVKRCWTRLKLHTAMQPFSPPFR